MARAGRKSMGPREEFRTRPTAAISKRIHEDTKNGTAISYSQFIANILAQHYGLPAYNDPAAELQQELPMTA